MSASDHVRGDPRAPVTIIEYSDFQCPFCARLHRSLRTLVDKGEIRWVYRHYPLNQHALAEPAAEASECAAQQGRFWEFADSLYSEPPRSIKEISGTRVAALGLDPARFNGCMAGEQASAFVATEKQQGTRLQIDATPTFFIDSERYVGDMPLPRLEEIVVAQRHHE